VVRTTRGLRPSQTATRDQRREVHAHAVIRMVAQRYQPLPVAHPVKISYLAARPLREPWPDDGSAIGHAASEAMIRYWSASRHDLVPWIAHPMPTRSARPRKPPCYSEARARRSPRETRNGRSNPHVGHRVMLQESWSPVSCSRQSVSPAADMYQAPEWFAWEEGGGPADNCVNGWMAERRAHGAWPRSKRHADDDQQGSDEKSEQPQPRPRPVENFPN
jgi:hypothetical protein